LSLILLAIIVLSSKAQAVKASSLEMLEKFSIDCQHFDKEDESNF